MQPTPFTPAVAMYLRLATSAQEASAELLRMFMALPAAQDGTPAADALWHGYKATRNEAIRFTEWLREYGGLLFFGQTAAHAIATSMEATA